MAIGISCNNPPQADIGAAYSHAFPATGDTPPDVFDIPSGSLPAGLTIDAGTGVVSGTPTGPAGTSAFAVRVTDSTLATATVNCSITVNGQLILTTGNAPFGYLGIPYSHSWVATGGDLPLTFRILSGRLPEGLGLNATSGLISGTPLVLGLSIFTIRVTDALGTTADVTFGLWIYPASYLGNRGGSSC